MSQVTLVLPEQPWKEFHQKTRIAQARYRLYEDRTFRDLWASEWSQDKAKAMYDRAVELGEEPEFARLVVKDIMGCDPKGA